MTLFNIDKTIVFSLIFIIMKSKICTKCGCNKSLSDFRKNKNTKDGLRTECKACSKSMNKNYYENNKEKVKETTKNWLVDNSDKMKLYNDNWSKSNPKKRRLYSKKWSNNNQEQVRNNHNEYERKRRAEDPKFKLKCYIRTMIKRSLRNKGYNKKSQTQTILGCDYDEFIKHIESKWESWMNWDNYGKYNGTEKYGWDMDHITPLAKGKTEGDILKLNHYLNIQPLCSYINRDVKRDK